MYKIHGQHGTKLYEVWHHMKQRCNGTLGDIPTKNYKDRNITYCKEWEQFENFYKDMSPSYQDGLQLDRIDNSKGYYPENCRWVTAKENNRNKRSNIWIEYKGKKRLLVELCEELEISYTTVSKRYCTYKIRDPEKLFFKGNLSIETNKNKPVLPCIICGTLGGTVDKKSGRPKRKRGMCNTCYQREITNKKNKKMEE